MSNAILPSSLTSPSIILHNGKPAITSLNVAEVFGKRHDHVFNCITQIKPHVDPEFWQSNFERSEYTNARGNAQPMYNLTQNALVLIVMGYGGKTAMQFKAMYIQDFSEMKKQIESQSIVEDCTPFEKLLNLWGNLNHNSHN